jgi:soluble lytic murein transglycosylase-like protein
MSIESVLDRMNALQAMMDSATGGAVPATTPATSADFSAALSTANAATGDGTTSDDDASSSAATLAALSSPLGSTAAPTTATASTGISTLPAGTPYGDEITAAAQQNGLDPALLAGLIKQESGFKADARSGAGAQGLTQLMPGTAAGLGVTNLLDPVQSIQGGAKYLKQQLDRFGGDPSKALAAYNAGPGAVAKYGGVPPYAETQNYVKNVLGYAAEYRGAGATSAATTATTTAATTSAVPLATQPVSAASLLATTDDTDPDADATDDASSTSGSLDYSTI